MGKISFASILLCLVCWLLPAQIGTEGAFFGTVTDSSGSSVPGAEVVATHLDTHLSKHSLTDAQGNFSILALPIGTYSVTVKATGFKTWEVTAAELTVGDRTRLSPVLSVGDISESVSVSANAELLQTEKSSAETVVQMKQILELPLDTRNPLALVSLVPGMRYVSTENGGERGTYTQGQGLRQNRTEFTLDGFISNAPMDEGGTAIPNVDAVAEFSVEMNFSAENGRDPMQVKVATKSGTNEFHGSAWEYNQNDDYNARNTFARTTPRVRYNQFGGAVGGPVIHNKTFFYGNFQGTVIHNAQVFNQQAVTPAMEQGDFSALKTTIIDPLNNAPFAGNIIPQSRFNSASAYFLPKLMVANAPGGLFQANAGTVNDTWEGTGRIDHQITANQRIYGRYVTVREPNTLLGYEPSAVTNDLVSQHNLGVNYTWMISSNTVLTLGGGMLRTRESYTNSALGVNNDALSAGIQGFPTAGREKWIGPPNINFGSGYTGISYAGWGVPGALYGGNYTGKADLRHVWHGHTLVVGMEYDNVHTYGDHGSCCVRGTFNFTNLYTGDGFADYLLGLTSGSSKNAPLAAFGTDSAPYAGIYFNDSWRIRPNFSVELGLRYEYWFGRHDAHDAASTWDPTIQKVIAANDSSGNINLNAFLTTQGIAAATSGLWETARQAGYPDNLFAGSGNWGPHVGLVYRPANSQRIVIRSGYGLYYAAMTGNRSASSAANLPFWGVESLSYSLTQLQNWQTVWSSDPNSYGIFSIGESQDPRIRPARTNEWNLAVQTALPMQMALSVSYVGTKVDRDLVYIPYNAPPIGPNANLQADRPDPLLSSISRLENFGRAWYHALQTKLERRFASGVAFTFSYSFSRSMTLGDNGVDEGTTILPYSPAWYNRGRAPFDYRHLEYATLLWDLPFGRGRKFHTDAGRLLDAVAGGWSLTLTQTARSGGPLSISGGYPNLGEGDGTRADIVGNPGIANPSPAAWFNTAAFVKPPLYAFGNSAQGILDGPGLLQFNTTLSKTFRVAERKRLQFRWDAFNTFNRVNYQGPSTNVASSLFGRITGANTARYMQLGLKFLF
jgi:hypothetical protein